MRHQPNDQPVPNDRVRLTRKRTMPTSQEKGHRDGQNRNEEEVVVEVEELEDDLLLPLEPERACW